MLYSPAGPDKIPQPHLTLSIQMLIKTLYFHSLLKTENTLKWTALCYTEHIW